MSEIELFIAWSELKAQIWSQIQFMASISFGLIALAHFSSDRLNIVLVVVLALLYTGFFAHGLSVVRADFELIHAIYRQAEELAAREGSSPSIGALAMYRSTVGGSGPLFFVGVIPSVYFGSLGYLVYRYIVTRRQSDRSAS